MIVNLKENNTLENGFEKASELFTSAHSIGGQANVATAPSVITADRSMTELLQLSETVAKSKAAILIQGDAGSGKKLLAQWIHQKSQRVHKTLQIFNCSLLSRGEQESQFNSLIEGAHGGTFLILEVSKLSPVLQARLVQVLQEGMLLKGPNAKIPVDVRVIATSTTALASLVKQNEFREDLYYRLNVVNLKIPTLQERLGDVEVLSKIFAKKWGMIHQKREVAVSQEAVQLLNSHRWSGNVRELDQTIERAVLLTQVPELRAKDIQIQNADSNTLSQGPVNAFAWKPGRTLDEIERNVILEALKYHSGNRTHTAKALGISIRTLRNKLAEYRVMGIHA